MSEEKKSGKPMGVFKLLIILVAIIIALPIVIGFCQGFTSELALLLGK